MNKNNINYEILLLALVNIFTCGPAVLIYI